MQKPFPPPPPPLLGSVFFFFFFSSICFLLPPSTSPSGAWRGRWRLRKVPQDAQRGFRWRGRDRVAEKGEESEARRGCHAISSLCLKEAAKCCQVESSTRSRSSLRARHARGLRACSRLGIGVM